VVLSFEIPFVNVMEAKPLSEQNPHPSDEEEVKQCWGQVHHSIPSSAYRLMDIAQFHWRELRSNKCKSISQIKLLSVSVFILHFVSSEEQFQVFACLIILLSGFSQGTRFWPFVLVSALPFQFVSVRQVWNSFKFQIFTAYSRQLGKFCLSHSMFFTKHAKTYKKFRNTRIEI